MKLLFVFSVCRDFMDPTMDSTKHILNYLMPILEQVDTELHDFMIRYTFTPHTVFKCAVAAQWMLAFMSHPLKQKNK